MFSTNPRKLYSKYTGIWNEIEGKKYLHLFIYINNVRWLPNPCSCGKSFNQQENLKIHAGTHTREKPYACEHCDKSFTTQGWLNRHIRTHAGDKSYTCEHCGKSFDQEGNLMIHARTHTVEKQ